MKTPPAPLFRDPIFDGAADPTLIWNHQEKQWWILYTCRRANVPTNGVSFVHGSDIGICSSVDGQKWLYRGIVPNLNFEPGRNTFWAPEVIEDNGLYHMFVSYVRGIPVDWDEPRHIVHYAGEDLWNLHFCDVLELSSDKVIDPCIYKVDDCWKMWYKDEVHQSHTYASVSRDLYHWEAHHPEITDCPHEGPNVFFYQGYAWMITDPWDGLGVYRSTDFSHWERMENILREPGTRQDDNRIGQHADIAVFGENAYIFYHTHPGLANENRQNNSYDWNYAERQSGLQVAKLQYQNGKLLCNRDEPFELLLTPPEARLASVQGKRGI